LPPHNPDFLSGLMGSHTFIWFRLAATGHAANYVAAS
jgi:hypothetical protein